MPRNKKLRLKEFLKSKIVGRTGIFRNRMQRVIKANKDYTRQEWLETVESIYGDNKISRQLAVSTWDLFKFEEFSR